MVSSSRVSLLPANANERDYQQGHDDYSGDDEWPHGAREDIFDGQK
jgi:hypothetical protein